MKKKSLVLMFLIITLSIIAGSLVYASEPISIYLNGNKLTSDTNSQIIDGRVMVPIRFIAENFGAQVEWFSNTNSVVIKSEKPEYKYVTLNGELTTWPYWYDNGTLYLEYRDTLQLIKEYNPHPNYVAHFYKSSNTLMVDGKNMDIPVKDEGEYRVVSLNYLKAQKIIDYDFDLSSGKMTFKDIK